MKDDLTGLKATALKEEAKEKFAILNPGDDDKLSTNNNEAGDFGAKNPAWEEEVKKHHAALKALTADVAVVVAVASVDSNRREFVALRRLVSRGSCR